MHRDATRRWNVVEQESRELLRARGRPDLTRLLSVIREVNPTARDLTTTMKQARYALKSALQSVLVRHFFDDLSVETDRDPDIVLLRHAALDRDGCHARLSELEDDARSLVRHALDTRGTGSATHTAQGPHSTPTTLGEPLVSADLVIRGRAALEAYDYDLARTLLTQSLAQRAGSVDAAVALLELLVDHLAADDEAVALAARLPAATVRHPDVASLLALAAARSGDAERALVWVEQGRAERAADVFACLARRALDFGDLTESRRLLEHIRARSPQHAEIAAIEQRIATHMARERAPVEGEIRAALAASRWDDAQRLAADALLRWPDHEVSRRALAAVHRHRQAQRSASLRALATSALAEGRLDDAARELAALREAGAPEAPLERALATALDAARLAGHERAAVEIAARLEGASMREVLAQWMELPGGVRARVRALHPDRLLDAMERLEPKRAALEATVEALVAWRAAEAECEDPERRVQRLEAHEEVLRQVPAARHWMSAARQEAATARRLRALAALDEATRSLDRSDLGGARGALDRAHANDLDAQGVSRLGTLNERVAVMAHREALLRVVDARLREDDPMAAVMAIDRLVRALPEAERDRLSVERAPLSDALRRQWRVRVVEGEGRVDELADLSIRLLSSERAEPSLSPDGHELALATSCGRWIFVRIVRCADGVVVRRLSLRAPTPMEGLEARWRGGELTLTDDCGNALVMDVVRGDALRWYRFTPTLPRGLRVGAVLLFEAERAAWISVEGLLPGWTEVTDLDTGRVLRTLDEAHPGEVRGVAGVDAFWSRDFSEVRFHRARGQGSDLAPVRSHEVGAIAPHPTLDAMVMTAWRLDSEREEEPPPWVEIMTLRRDGRVVSTVPLSDEPTIADSLHTLGVSRDAGVACVIGFDRERGAWWLYRLHADGDSWRRDPRLGVRGRSMFVCDHDARHLAWVAATARGLKVLDPVTACADDLAECRSWEGFDGLDGLFHCSPRDAEGERKAERLRAEIMKTPAETLDSVVGALRQRAARDRAGQLALFYALEGCWLRELAATTLHEARAQFPDDPMIALEAADAAGKAGRWDDVHATLAPFSDDPHSAAHVHHLLALAALHLGAGAPEVSRHLHAAEAALRPVATAAEAPSRPEVSLALFPCELELVRQRAACDPSRITEADLDPSADRLSLVTAACVLADRAFAVGDPREALRVLNRPPVLGSEERQGSSRVAAARLAIVADDEIDRFHKALALAHFASLQGQSRVSNLPLPGRWPDAHLEALVERATCWLEEVYARGAADEAAALRAVLPA